MIFVRHNCQARSLLRLHYKDPFVVLVAVDGKTGLKFVHKAKAKGNQSRQQSPGGWHLAECPENRGD